MIAGGKFGQLRVPLVCAKICRTRPHSAKQRQTGADIPRAKPADLRCVQATRFRVGGHLRVRSLTSRCVLRAAAAVRPRAPPHPQLRALHNAFLALVRSSYWERRASGGSRCDMRRASGLGRKSDAAQPPCELRAMQGPKLHRTGQPRKACRDAFRSSRSAARAAWNAVLDL